MDSPSPGLAFEQPIFDLESELARLENASEKSTDHQERVRDLKRQIADRIEEIYGQLSPWETVQVARHKDRPHTADYLNLVFDGSGFDYPIVDSAAVHADEIVARSLGLATPSS